MKRTQVKVLALFVILCSLTLLGQMPRETLAQTGEIEVDNLRGVQYQTSEDVFSNAAVNGTFYWWVPVKNQESGTLNGATVEVVTRLPSTWFEYFGPDPNSTLQKGDDYLYTWKMGSIAPRGEQGISLGSKSVEKFAPGFDSRRVLIPGIIESQISNQTVVVSVTPRESLQRIEAEVYLEQGTGVSAAFILSTALPKVDWTWDDGRGLGWGLDNPKPNHEYTFRVMLQLKNPTYPNKMFYKPRVTVRSIEGREQTRSRGSSLVAKDEVLGTITYSLPGNHEWFYYHDHRKEVVHRYSLGVPFVALMIDSPTALSVVKGVMNISASAVSSSGTVLAMQCRIDGGEWMPLNPGNETQKEYGYGALGAKSAYVGSIDWDTTPLPDGPHEITIRAEDSNGIADNKTITVIVDNSGPRFVGYSQIINFVYVVAIVIGIVGLVWIVDRKRR